MIIKTSATLRNDYAAISNIDQILQLRVKVLQAEQERLDGADTISVSEARKQLKERETSML